MTFQPVPNTVLLEFRFITGTTPWINTVYAQNPLGYDAESLDTLLDAVESSAENGVITILATDTAYTGVTATGLNTAFDISGSRSPAVPVPGETAGNSVPINAAFCVQFNAGLTGRSTRNRNYVGGIPESVVNEKSVNATFANNLVAGYDGLKAAIFSAGWTQVIVSRYALGVKRVVAETWPVVNILYTDLRIDTRRSRLNNV